MRNGDMLEATISDFTYYSHKCVLKKTESVTMAVGIDDTINALRMKFNTNAFQGLGWIERINLSFEVKAEFSVHGVENIN